jgi:hypothetical protein
LINEVLNPSFEENVAEWQGYLGGSAESWTLQTNTTPSAIFSGEKHGHAFGVNPAGAARSKYVWELTPHPVEAGEIIYLHINATNPVGGIMRLGVRHDNGGWASSFGFTPKLDGIAHPGGAGDVPKRLAAFYTVPPGVVAIQLGLQLENVPAGANYGLMLDAAQFVRIDSLDVAVPTYFDGDTPGAEWLGSPHLSASRYPATGVETVIPGFEIEASRRAFPKTQELFAGATERKLGSFIPVGWHGTETYEEGGAIAVVRVGGPYEDLVGDFVRVEHRTREVFVYVAAARDVPADLSLSRRAFAALGGLYRSSIPATVEVIA